MLLGRLAGCQGQKRRRWGYRRRHVQPGSAPRHPDPHWGQVMWSRGWVRGSRVSRCMSWELLPTDGAGATPSPASPPLVLADRLQTWSQKLDSRYWLRPFGRRTSTMAAASSAASTIRQVASSRHMGSFLAIHVSETCNGRSTDGTASGMGLRHPSGRCDHYHQQRRSGSILPARSCTDRNHSHPSVFLVRFVSTVPFQKAWGVDGCDSTGDRPITTTRLLGALQHEHGPVIRATDRCVGQDRHPAK